MLKQEMKSNPESHNMQNHLLNIDFKTEDVKIDVCCKRKRVYY